jgi:hypothetical protein
VEGPRATRRRRLPVEYPRGNHEPRPRRRAGLISSTSRITSIITVEFGPVLAQSCGGGGGGGSSGGPGTGFGSGSIGSEGGGTGSGRGMGSGSGGTVPAGTKAGRRGNHVLAMRSVITDIPPRSSPADYPPATLSNRFLCTHRLCGQLPKQVSAREPKHSGQLCRNATSFSLRPGRWSAG